MFSKGLARILSCWVIGRQKRRKLRHKLQAKLSFSKVSPLTDKQKQKFYKKVKNFKIENAAFLENYADKYELISLGSNCLSRTIPTR